MNTFKRFAICIALASISTLSACVLYRGHHHHDHDGDQYQERHHGRDWHDHDSDDAHHGEDHDRR